MHTKEIASLIAILLVSSFSVYLLITNSQLNPSKPENPSSNTDTNSTASSEDINKEFEKFKKTYRKRYAGPESQYRLDIFASNFNYINNFNNNSTKAIELAVNEFTDLSLEEFKELYFGHDPSINDNDKKQPKKLRQNFQLSEAVPDAVDWRNKLSTPIQKQGVCGSCWAFSTVVALEAAYAKQSGTIVKFSEQNLMDCCRLENRGCNGGDPAPALDCVLTILKGIMAEEQYPYQAVNRKQCDHEESMNVFSPDSYDNIPTNNELAMKEAVAKQPISVCISASSQAFQHYKSGIADTPNLGCNTDAPDHCLGIVGYGVENNKMYWIVKNSWGETWGENGYIRMARSESTSNVGTCAIANEPRIVNWSGKATPASS